MRNKNKKFFTENSVESKKEDYNDLTETEKDKNEEISAPPPEFVVEVIDEDNTIKLSLNEYLATYSRNRTLDTVITKWCIRNGMVGKKSVDLWDGIISNFYKETDTK